MPTAVASSDRPPSRSATQVADEAGHERAEADERPQSAQQRLALLADAELRERQAVASPPGWNGVTSAVEAA